MKRRHLLLVHWLTACALTIGAQPALARQSAPPASAASVAAHDPNEAQLQEHGHYVNKSGRVVHSPAHSVNGTARMAHQPSAVMAPTALASTTVVPARIMVVWRSGCSC